MSPGWMDEAECKGMDPELFFPSRGESTREAKAVCAECSVRSECIEHALTHGEKQGIWGGVSERERRRMRKERVGATRPDPVLVHGTHQAYRRCLKRPEGACTGCREAHTRWRLRSRAA